MPPPADPVIALRACAERADAVDATQPDREFTIYYDYPGCVKDHECRVATAWCSEWADWIAATTPRKVLALLDRLAAAEAVVEAARYVNAWDGDPNADHGIDRLVAPLAAYDRAIGANS